MGRPNKINGDPSKGKVTIEEGMVVSGSDWPSIGLAIRRGRADSLPAGGAWPMVARTAGDEGDRLPTAALVSCSGGRRCFLNSNEPGAAYRAGGSFCSENGLTSLNGHLGGETCFVTGLAEPEREDLAGRAPSCGGCAAEPA